MQNPERKIKWVWLGAVFTMPLLGLMVGAASSSLNTNPPAQPLDFYHNVHVQEKQIACAYCHRTASTADYAGMPSAQLCLGCHRAIIPEFTEIWKLRSYWELGQPIPWKRVNQLPAHVYFSHKAHTVIGKMGCDPCHGKVEIMPQVQQTAPLTMGWCVDCHRQQKASVDCWTCHR